MKELDKFGHFLVENLRDKALEQNEMLLEGKLRGKSVQALQDKVLALRDDQRELLRAVVIDMLDTAMHDLLFALQDAHDRELGIEVLVDGENVAEQSGMLNGEHIGEEGWIRRYSRYGGGSE
jgi:hypothetical protein